LDNKGIFKNIADESEGIISIRKYKPEKDLPKSLRVDLAHFSDAPAIAITDDTKPEEEILVLLGEILAAIKDVLTPHTVGFYWANAERKLFRLGGKLTESKSFLSDMRFAFGDDVLSQVFFSKRPELYKQIDAADELKFLKYYEAASGVKSFVGVPVMFKDKVFGVLFCDSLAKDSFGETDVVLLQKFARIFSSQLSSLDLKMHLIAEDGFLQTALAFAKQIKKLSAIPDIIDLVGQTIKDNFDFDYLTISIFKNASELAVKKVVANDDAAYIAEGTVLQTTGTLVGEVIRSSEHGTADDLATLRTPPARFFKDETFEYGNSFLAVPITYADYCYGVVTLESKPAKAFTEKNFPHVRFILDMMGFAFSSVVFHEEARANAVLDEQTGVLTKRTFFSRLRNELNRALRQNTEVCLLLVRFDEAERLKSRYKERDINTLFKSTARLLISSCRNYDLVGKYDDDTFVAGMIGISELNARLWADRIREQIINYPIQSGEEYKTIFASVSIGVSKLMHQHPDIDSLIEGAEKALHHAITSGGNSVKVF
jgi:diguanylate cyclase (GGDEF)-like protein